MSIYLKFFDDYVSKGLMPIAIHKGTKMPVELKWNTTWSIKRWRYYFCKNKDEYELGLLWNQGFVDVETDDAMSNSFLNRIIGDIPRPIYKSKRSYHNLFLTPNKELTKVNIYGKRKEKIEIIGRKCFSIAPPSIHADGISTYEFINNFWPPPDFPNELKAIYFQQKKIKIINKEKTISICSRCQGETCIHKKRLIKEVNYFKKKNMMWICKKCRVELQRCQEQ